MQKSVHAYLTYRAFLHDIYTSAYVNEFKNTYKCMHAHTHANVCVYIH